MTDEGPLSAFILHPSAFILFLWLCPYAFPIFSSYNGAAVDISEKIQNYLSPLLGANTARIAVRTFAEKIGKKPETLQSQDLPSLAQSMHGMLKTLCGAERADKAVRDISAL